MGYNWVRQNRFWHLWRRWPGSLVAPALLSFHADTTLMFSCAHCKKSFPVIQWVWLRSGVTWRGPTQGGELFNHVGVVEAMRVQVQRSAAKLVGDM